jgi:hypothetical protein
MPLSSLTRTMHKSLIFYSFLFVMALLVFILRDGFTPLTFVVFLALIPVFGFFAHSAWCQLVLLKQQDKKDWYFSWKAFFLQDNGLFLLTLALFVFVINLALVRKTQSFINLFTDSTEKIENITAQRNADD